LKTTQPTGSRGEGRSERALSAEMHPRGFLGQTFGNSSLSKERRTGSSRLGGVPDWLNRGPNRRAGSHLRGV